ncbi:hypothetical protein [Methylobacterium sp. R2-1]|uniref:hypothetical protein n=1 Tax=Methylobacterium sp. R2-1 TaxID=2587064 RepID=UPI001845AA1E|nr:hypothetical protein [Methylobacterium sp. R2-1]MBB2962535.1 hypothetical protein [Methylobacterium sp. R2-1]
MHLDPSPAVAAFAAPPALVTPAAQVGAAPSAVILFGRDEQGRPHASRFDGSNLAGVEAAARLMGLHLGVADTAALRDLANRFPAGRLFPSGKGFVPFVKADLYARLLAATGTPDTPMPGKAAGKPADAPPPTGAGSGGKGSPDAPGGAPKAPNDWAAIGIGSTVLACQGPMEGWWEAVVLYTKANDAFVLRWRDFPDDGEFTRARKDLALMPPGSREGLG